MCLEISDKAQCKMYYIMKRCIVNPMDRFRNSVKYYELHPISSILFNHKHEISFS